MEIEIKDGRIWSIIRKKWLVLTPEEEVRQKYLCTLIEKYGYVEDQIDEEIDITGLYSTKRRPDFVIWRTSSDKKLRKSPFIIVECKAENVSITKKAYEQGELYARTAGASFFVTHNNIETKYWRVIQGQMPGFIQEISDIPNVNASDKEINEIIENLKTFKENEFADLLHQCHNIIRNREKLDPAAAFDEIAKILFMKVYAERRLKADLEGNIFTLDYIEEGEKYNPDYLYDIFQKTKKDFGRDKIFNQDEKINLRVSTIKTIVKKLEVYNLSDTSTDIKGIAFEKFLGKTFRGEIGQFFTPRKVVNFMVDMLQPKEGEVMCDPASGSGGFLIRFFELIREQICASVDNEYLEMKEIIQQRNDLSNIEKARQLNEGFKELMADINPQIVNSRLWKLSNRNIYGVDANDRMARTSKMNMIMHGDGHGGIHHHDGFLNVNGIFEERFDIILTNPPFGQTVDKEDEILLTQASLDEEMNKYYSELYGSKYEDAHKNILASIGKPLLSLYKLPIHDKIKTELLFLERCLNLLVPGGRMGIVLPEGVFNTSSVDYVREFVEQRAFILAIISLPQETFASSGAQVKASLLFLKKYSNDEKNRHDNLLKEKFDKEYTQYEEEIKILEEQLKSSRGLIKKETLKEIKSIHDKIIQISNQKAKDDWSYKIFFQEAQFVGINGQGEDVEENDLPLIYSNYLKYLNFSDEIILETKGLDPEDRRIFIADYKDLRKWTIPPKLLLNIPNPFNWEILKLGDYLSQIEDKEKVRRDMKYQMVGIKLYGNGLFKRDFVSGSEISASWVYPLRERAFIYSRLFAWRGTFGIVGNHFLGCYVSNEFPQFVVNENRILPEYLFFIFNQEFALKAVKAASGGSAAISRNRFKEEDFLEFYLPIPPLETQRKVVEFYLDKVNEAEELKKRASFIINDCGKIITQFIFGEIGIQKF
jgi:type I restriction enzyme M protein